MTTWYQFNQDAADYPAPGVGLAADLAAPHEIVNARDPASKDILIQSAIEGHVLVKNTNSALPLKSPKLLSIFGYSANSPLVETYSTAAWSPWGLGMESANVDEIVSGFIDVAPLIPVSQIAINGTIISGGGSGSNTPAYINSPFEALQQKAWENDSMYHLTGPLEGHVLLAFRF